jgi:hypothetical protein
MFHCDEGPLALALWHWESKGWSKGTGIFGLCTSSVRAKFALFFLSFLFY